MLKFVKILTFINTSPWGVTETILQSVTLAFVIAFPLNYTANIVIFFVKRARFMLIFLKGMHFVIL